jgi:hypothetical protein
MEQGIGLAYLARDSVANNTLLDSDTFPLGSLASSWGSIFGLPESQFSSGPPYYAQPSAINTQCGQQWPSFTSSVDHSSEITVHTLTSESGTTLSLCVRMQSGSYSGYQADISNGTVVFNLYVNGTPTQLGVTKTGLTFASGDIWCLQAAGSLISLWQNSSMVYYWWDATYTAGVPGFSQKSTVATTHCQVGSWRGYSGQSQDGIWQHGDDTGLATLFAPIASELGHGITGVQGVQNPYFLYEGNPHILAGPEVYKIYFMSSSGGNSVGMGYAESATGKPGTYVRAASLLIPSATLSCTVWKHPVTGLYYVFEGGGTAIRQHTSTDGFSNWSNNGTVLTNGTSGTWNAGYIQIFAVIYYDPVNDIAYAKCDGWSQGGAPNGADIGIFTASAPYTNWTPYASNPVVTNFFGSTQSYEDANGNLFFWGCSVADGNNLDPPDAVRCQTSFPFTPDKWINKTISIHHAQQYSGSNVVQGGVYPIWVFSPPTDPNNTYYYYEAWVQDSVGGEGYQFYFAMSPLPLATIVQNQESGLLPVASDSFNSGSGNLSSNWSTITGITKLQIVSGSPNVVEATATSVNCAQIYTGASFSPNQYSSVTIQTMTANAFILPFVRMQGSGLNGYYARLTGPTGIQQGLTILKTVNASNTQIGPSYQTGVHVGDNFMMVAYGSSPVILILYKNGYQILIVQDYSNQYTSGNPGIGIFTNVLANGQVLNWSGGNANQAVLTSNYSANGPSSGLVGIPSSSFNISPSSLTTDGVRLSDSGMGGTFTPNVISFFMSSVPQSFTYTPATIGAIPIVLTSDAGGSILGSPISYMSNGISNRRGACLLAAG